MKRGAGKWAVKLVRCALALSLGVGSAFAGAVSGKAAAVSSAGQGLAELVFQYCGAGERVAGVTAEWCSMEQREIRLRPREDGAGDGAVALEVLVAADDRTRQAGYQWIDPGLAQTTATLFLFPRPIYGAFHMCNVDAPLWIAWYDEDGSPLDVTLMLPGADVPAAFCRDLYAPRTSGTYRYALEIGVGLARELELDRQRLMELSLVVEPWMAQGR